MITSTANEVIKNIRKLRDKKYRVASHSAFVEGTKLVIDALEQGVEIERIIISQSYSDSDKRKETSKRLLKCVKELTLVSDEVFLTLANKDNPQGIGAVVKQSWLKLDQADNLLSSGLWVGLFEIADPGNLGTILRTVDAAGWNGVLLIGNCADPYDPTAIRASMGALFSNTVVKTDTERFLKWKQNHQIQLIGTSDSANTHYRDFSYSRDMILLMGSEREGLPEEMLRVCDENVKIPMHGSADSLNLAVATGIFLYEITNQTNQSAGNG